MSSVDQIIEKRIVIHAKGETAFRALTEARSLARWFANRAESKPVEGGSLLLMWGTGEQVEGARATFTRLVPGREVSLQWVSKIKPGETIAVTGQHSSTFRIDPSPEGVIVTMRYMADPPPADNERMKMDQDWDQAMVSLKALCEGPDAPAGDEGAAGGPARAASGMGAEPIERVRVVATPKAKKPAKAKAKPKAKKKAAAKKSAKPKKKVAAKAKKKPAKKKVRSAAKRAKAKPKAKAKSKKPPKKKTVKRGAKKSKSSKKAGKKSARKAKKK